MKEVVCYESEITMANHKMKSYLRFLYGNVMSFEGIIEEIKLKGLVDEEIDGKLTIIAETLKKYMAEVVITQNHNIEITKKEVQEISDVEDEFAFS